MKLTIPITLALILFFVLASAQVRAQYSQKSPGEILREAQERQRAIDQAGADFRQKANEILEQQRRQQKAERDDRDAQRDSEKQERRDANLQKSLQDTINQQQETVRRQQEQIQQTLGGNAGTRKADSTRASGFAQPPPPVVNTGSIADTYRQAANQNRWAAKEYRAKGQNDKASQALNEAAKYDKMAQELDAKQRPVALDMKPAPKPAQPRTSPRASASQKPQPNKCPKCGFVDHPMSARTTCPRCNK